MTPATRGGVGESARGPARNCGSRFGRRIVAISAFAIAVPATGILIAAPLWYVSTHLRGTYTVLLVGAVLALFVRRVARQVRHPNR